MLQNVTSPNRYHLLIQDTYFHHINILRNSRNNHKEIHQGILIAFLIFMIMGSGWVQFASRYSLDYQLMMLLFGLFIIKVWKKSRVFNKILIVLLLFSIYINYIGTLFYMHYEKVNRGIFATAEEHQSVLANSSCHMSLKMLISDFQSDVTSFNIKNRRNTGKVRC